MRALLVPLGPPERSKTIAGREDLAQRGLLMVDELKKAQDAHGNGYLSAFPQEHFDRLESLKPVWAPYYVVRWGLPCLLALAGLRIVEGL